MESEEPVRAGAGRGKRLMVAGGAALIAAGVVAGLLLLPAEWSWMRRAAGGCVIGAGIALMIFSWRLLVYDADDG